MADNWYQNDPIEEAPRAPAAPRPVARGSAAAQALGGSTTAQPPVQQPTQTAARGIAQPQASAPAADEWWAGDQIAQPQAAPVAPQREVGMGEGIARIIGQSAIPVARSLGLAAGGLARLVGGEQAQDAVFKATDDAVANMRREYEFQAGEQVGLPTQIVGGIASAPIEMVGGMGAQRGISTAADVLQRGGTGGEAAQAGAVSGAVNVGLNLLPVKAGGAAGRAVERVVSRGVGQRAAPIAAGAATGGGIAAAGDVAGTAAENAALPEGEEFADMRRESSPGIAAGLGAAFGGAAGRGASRAAARAAPAEPAAAAGNEAPAGSVGAAGADVETARRERAAALPVPIALSKGQASRSFADQQFERETAKSADTGEPLREHFAEQNERLARNFDAFVDETGAEQTSRRGVGEAVESALRQKMESRRDEIRRAYDAAREAGDMAEPVKTDDLVAYLNETGPESINAPVLQTVREKLVQLGGAKRDGEGGLTASEIPLNDLEEIRKMINRVSDSSPTNMTFGREIKDRIDRLTADAGGDLYREARRLRTNFAREFNDRAVINDLVRNKRGSADRAVALEDVFDKAILRRSLDDVRHLRRVLQTAGEGGQQAWRELQGQAMRHIQEAAMRGTQRDQRGNVVVSHAGLERAIRELDADGRLDFIFGKKGAEQLRDLRDISADVLTAPPGSVNTSNTSSAIINAIDTLVTFTASGLPVPAFALLRKALATAKERGTRKRIAQALEQPADLMPGGERQRFGSDQVDAETGEVTQQAAPSQAAAPADPRLDEIARLRAATTNAEALDVLDRRQRKIEAEIAADRQQAERNQQAEELDALARGSSDPEIRKALAARAEKLRGGAIPVGEAREVTVIDQPPAEPVEPTQIPTGEAVELTPEQVEPAPRPAEAPRSAAGSDTEAELTMLQPGAPARGTRRQPMYKRAGIKAPETPEFKRWFGESKVVDEAGAPMVVFHGTKGDVSEFKMRSAGKHDHGEYGRGFYFSPHADTASLYADLPQHAAEPGAPNVMPTFVSLKNPARLERNQSVDSAAEAAALTKKLKAAGHDGVMVYDKGKLLEIVAFDPAQIKSAIGNRGAFNPEDRGIMNKQGGGLPTNPFKARAELENNLRAKFGHKLIDALQKRNVITMGDAPADVPRDAQGRFTGNTVELFHNRLDADTAPGVLMHEVGMHYGMAKMLGEQRYAELLADVAKMRQRPEVAKAWADVERNYPELKPGDDDFVSEVAAHLVESAPGQPIVRRIIDAPRAYLYRQFGVNVGKADPGLLRALAVGALRKSAGVEAVSPNPAALATAGEVEEEETATQ